MRHGVKHPSTYGSRVVAIGLNHCLMPPLVDETPYELKRICIGGGACKKAPLRHILQ